MLHKVIAMTAALVLCTGILLADVTGKYSVEIERPAGAEGRGGGPGGGGRMGGMQTTLNLKEEGGKLTGTAEMGAGERARTVDITNGKIEGGKFSFETVLETPMGTMTMLWDGKVEGAELKGTRAMKEVDRPPMNFTAKKAE
ncbi:MAG: hypothetical protein KIT83_02180 [Bryobacterales bacterium]|nr:hypothetical protein [Bryobacterales bacterium]